VVVLEGQKNRLVQVVFPPPAPKPLPPAPIAQTAPEVAVELEPTVEKKPILPWVLGGVGVLGVSTFVGLGLSGLRAEEDLEDTCAPECAPSEVQSVRNKYVLADVGLAVGLASLGAAAYLLFWRGAEAGVETDGASLGLDLRQGGGSLLLGGRF